MKQANSIVIRKSGYETWPAAMLTTRRCMTVKNGWVCLCPTYLDSVDDKFRTSLVILFSRRRRCVFAIRPRGRFSVDVENDRKPLGCFTMAGKEPIRSHADRDVRISFGIDDDRDGTIFCLLFLSS